MEHLGKTALSPWFAAYAQKIASGNLKKTALSPWFAPSAATQLHSPLRKMASSPGLATFFILPIISRVFAIFFF